MLKATREYGEFETDTLVVSAKSKIDEINKKIQSIEVGGQVVPAAPQQTNEFWDWSKSYEKWSDWDKLENLHDRKQAEETKLTSLYEKQEAFAHNHDHTIERQFFTLPEVEKFQACQRHFRLGEYLLQEGMYHKALEQFQIMIAYYEYCFPDDTNESEKHFQPILDTLREESYIYTAAAYMMSHEYRKAIESVNSILRDHSQYNVSLHSKDVLTEYIDTSPIDRIDRARLQRAIAYRILDEYDEAKEDLLQLRSKYATENELIEEAEVGEENSWRKEWQHTIEEEWTLLHTLIEHYQRTSKKQFGGLFEGNPYSESHNNSAYEHDHEHIREEVAIRAPISAFASSTNTNMKSKLQLQEDSPSSVYEEHSYDKKSLPLQEYIPIEVSFATQCFPTIG